jgi:hypothetical protein
MCNHLKIQCLCLECWGTPACRVSDNKEAQTQCPSSFPHQTGDQIVEVNGIDFSNLDHKEVRRGGLHLWPLLSIYPISHPQHTGV